MSRHVGRSKANVGQVPVYCMTSSPLSSLGSTLPVFFSGVFFTAVYKVSAMNSELRLCNRSPQTPKQQHFLRVCFFGAAALIT